MTNDVDSCYIALSARILQMEEGEEFTLSDVVAFERLPEGKLRIYQVGDPQNEEVVQFLGWTA
jgi:hypothetical protein